MSNDATTKPTAEEKNLAFEEAITNMQVILAEGTLQGMDVSPLAMILLDHVPDLTGSPLKTLLASEKQGSTGRFHALLVNPAMVTPPGLPPMPTGMFWTVLRALGHKLGAIATIVGMEAWTTEIKGSTRDDDIPADLSTYEGRKESLVVTAERQGDKRIYMSQITRENDVPSFGPWKQTADGRAEGRIFNTVPGNTLS